MQRDDEKGEAERDDDDDDAVDELLRAIAHSPPQRVPTKVGPGTACGPGGRYVVERTLGRGGMGVVYQAEDTLLKRPVALKLLGGGEGRLSNESRALLLREARFAARAEHQRVARVYDAGEHEGAAFVAMEFVRGTTLRRWMSAHSPTAADVIRLGEQIAEGLAALHGAGVLHRDLKPENVMIADDGSAKLLDFGLARGLDGQRPSEAAPTGGDASSTSHSGTPGYMAPEQYAGGDLDARVDVFALGVLLYELVEGERPFGGATPAEAQASMRRPPTFEGERWRQMPEAMRALVARALCPDKERRFADGSELLAALRRVGTPAQSPTPASPNPPATLPSATALAPTLASASASAPATAPTPTLASAPATALAPTLASAPAAPALASATAPTTALSKRRVRPAAVGAALVAAALAVGSALFLPRRPTLLPPPAGMVRIDVGTITIGRSPADLDRECRRIEAPCERKAMQREVPEAGVTLAAFSIDVDEVTNEQFAPWLNAIKGSLYVEDDADDHYPRYVHWRTRGGDEVLLDLHPLGGGIEYTPERTFRARAGRERWPVVQITWLGARAFCMMQGKRLPTENEWEATARGAQGRLYPWGEGPARCGGVVVPADGMILMAPGCPTTAAIAPVGGAPQDVTPEGVRGLAGNVSEWVDAAYVEGDRQAAGGAPRGAELPKIVRGGSFAESFSARTTARTRRPADAVGDNLGFRCAVGSTDRK